MIPYLKLLRHHPDFARVWLAGVVSLAGDWFNTIVLVALVSKLSDGSGVAVSMFLLARMLPPLLISPYAGVLADRLDRKRLMVIADMLRAVIVMLFLVAVHSDALWLIYLLTILQFAAGALFDPAKSALIPRLLPHDDLVLANTLGSITWSAMLAIGSLLGGIVASLFGVKTALVIDALTFLVSALLISTVHVPSSAVTVLSTQERATNGFRAGLRYALKDRATTAVLLVKSAENFGGNMGAIMAIFATQLYVLGENGEQSLGILYAASGIGAVLGPVLLNYFNDGKVRRVRRLITIGFGLIVLSRLVLGAAPSLFVVALAMLVNAMGGSANWTYSSVIIHKETPDAFMGRMFSLDMTALQIAGVASTLLTGWLIDLAGGQFLGVLMIGLAGVSLIPMWLWHVSMRQPNYDAVAAVQAAGD